MAHTPIRLRIDIIRLLGILLISANLLIVPYVCADETASNSANDVPRKTMSTPKVGDSSIWLTDAGNGFRAGTQVFGIGAEATYGLLMFGGNERHHLALGSLSYGRMIGGLQGEGKWYGGNWELWLELFGGSQMNSSAAYVIGLTPHLRYHFPTGTRLVPFIDAGAGVTLTDIGNPDLGSIFQFNTQAGIGVNWFVKDNVAIAIEGRYLHISSAGLSMPNDGVNTVGVFLGINWFF